MVERSTCPCGCGNPARLTLDADTNGYWETEQMVCQARAMLHEEQKKGGEPVPGELWRVRPADDMPHLSSRDG